MKIQIEQIKKIREQYGFPIWLINEALKYYNNNEDKAVERLIEIYNVIGDHPNVVVKRNIENFMNEVRHSKNLMDKDNSAIMGENTIKINCDKQEKIRILHQWCSSCSKAYDFTCSGKDAQKCNEQKIAFLKS